MTVRTVLGTCHHDCPDTCGWIATVEDGVVVRLRGNPDHPYSRGELCPKVNRFIDRVYSPERLLHPMIRSGAKGSGAFRRTTWDEALAAAANGLQAAIERQGGESVLPWWDAGTQGLLNLSSLDQRLFARMGASRLTGSLCGGTAAAGFAATTGSGIGADPMDVRHARLVLLWGTNTKLTNRHLWPFVEEARRAGASVVVIDPIRTATARAADWFIQPLPGTDVALMLALMHVLVRDDLVDRDYVARHTVGYEELAARVADWPPERAAAVCGVAVEEIECLARAYGTVRPAFIRTLIGAEHHENGAMFFRTLACLPALTGSWRERGGGLARSVGAWEESVIDYDALAPSTQPVTRGINMNRLGRVLTDERLDPPIAALVVWNGNPAVTVPNAEAIRRGLTRNDLFTIVSEQFMTDTARYADVVFPATTQLEQRDVVASWGHLYVGWNEPAVEPLGEAVPNTELWRRLARAMGYTEPELFESDDALLAAALARFDLDRLQTEGFVRLPVPDEILPYAEGGFATASGKAELSSAALGARGLDPLPAFVPATESRAGDAALAARYPLALLTPKHHPRLLNSSYTHLPKHGPVEGGPFVEMDAADAAARSLVDGDLAAVWNDRGRLELPVRVSDRLRPGVVAVPFGWWSADHAGGSTANSLTNDTLTDWGGGVAYSDTLVEVAALG